ncbi:ChaN family lipoprotein [Vibrio sp. B1Z05]|uniref:ChaN family lipoprotein n=1 Tax=Vibrio sp. B1Z05 TaxID=2654980 RepID=UPI0020A62581|nr:ChaN family lipoprotein [Vibrio sp. B1Z05]
MRIQMLSVLLLFALPISVANSSASNPASPILNFYDYQLYSASTKEAPQTTLKPLTALPSDIINADVVLVGEWHSHSAIHRFQAELYQKLLEHNTQVAVSMEQFSRPVQNTLDQYLKGEIGELALIAHAKAWPNYSSDYRALVEQAKSASMPVIAANAPREIVRCLGQVGVGYLESLNAEQRQNVATNLDITDRPYKDNFKQAMQGVEKASVEKMYAAQVAWDETMAESIAMHHAQYPHQQILHIAGKFHVENGMGIAYSLHQRAPKLKIVLITPVASLDEPLGMSQYSEYRLLVLPLPTQVINTHEHGSFSHSHSSSQSDCQ